MADEKEFIIAYEMCPIPGYTGALRDWVWRVALTPEDALQKFKEDYPHLVGKLCGLYVARVIK